MQTLSTSAALADVIRSCLDDERTLVQQSKVVDERRRELLARLAAERRRFAEDLERLNGQASRESWGSLVRELKGNLWERAAGPNAGDSVAACLRSQVRTEAHYERALEGDLPRELKAILSTQHERIVSARGELFEIAY